MSAPALHADNVRVELSSGDAVISGVDLRVEPGEILGLVGESGSGKTTTALSIFGYNAAGLKMTSGEIAIAGEELRKPTEFAGARGRLVSYVPQNPGTALNPANRVADAIEDMIRSERGAGELRERLLERVGLPGDRLFARRYPHQLSGGQQQRVCIAASLAPDPALVVLDEPTTGLDVVTQSRILAELLRLRDEQHVAMLYITHDLAVVAQIAGRIAVMYAGHIVEQGAAADILRHPRHPYTRGLIAATPDHLRPRMLGAMPGIAAAVTDRLPGCPFAARCDQRVDRCEAELPQLEPVEDAHLVRCLRWRETPRTRSTPLPSATRTTASEPVILEVEGLRAEYRGTRGSTVVVDDVSFELAKRSCLALVGESGSGKTTIARVIAGLHAPSAGRVLLAGEQLAGVARKRTVEQRRRVQIVFQNPTEALNPRHTVAESLERPARLLRRLGPEQARAEVARLLEGVRLPGRIARRYPRELSGGERQRVAIARALAAGPEVLVCDEITSALDVSVQAVVLELLRELGDELGLALIFITHDLGVVATIAQRTLVLESGSICEEGATRDVLESPAHPYTRRLLDAAPSLSAAIDAWDAVGAVPMASDTGQPV
ncbi:MAG TPA: ABC transporter ATP-binding protein [Solirubrobacteraceae bacterium]|jgi:peptide/nickel transport system ATP-binding protein|nr:ABC transporter ATP-binding protein [Solirubrobacteraceae bacterium]